MTDKVSSLRRSEIMSSIKSKDTKPEIIVRKFLHLSGLRYRLHDKKLIGKPDIKLTKYKTVIFVNGCFWHGHKDCKIYALPKSNVSFWQDKFEKNIQRDAENIKALKTLGWKVIVLWECELKGKKRIETLNRLIEKILVE